MKFAILFLIFLAATFFAIRKIFAIITNRDDEVLAMDDGLFFLIYAMIAAFTAHVMNVSHFFN